MSSVPPSTSRLRTLWASLLAGAVLAVALPAPEAEAHKTGKPHKHRPSAREQHKAVAAPAKMTPATLLVHLREDGGMDVMAGKEANAPRVPASLTKLLTAELIFEALKGGQLTLDQELPISWLARNQKDSHFCALPSDVKSLTVEEALVALLQQSSNLAAVVLAEGHSDSETAFAAKMNTTAHALGMSDSRFANASGLPARGQITTANDMARLAQHIVTAHAEYVPLFTKPDPQIGEYPLEIPKGSPVRLIDRLPGLEVGKSGYTFRSAHNLLLAAHRDGRRLIAIVMGEPTRDRRNSAALSLLEEGFTRLGVRYPALPGTNIPPRP